LCRRTDRWGTAWTAVGFGDGGWTSGPSNIGYDTGTGRCRHRETSPPQGTAHAIDQLRHQTRIRLRRASTGNSGTFTPHARRARLVLVARLGWEQKRSRKSCSPIARAAAPERLSNFSRLGARRRAARGVRAELLHGPLKGGGYASPDSPLSINLPAGTQGRQVKVQILGLNNAGNGYLSLGRGLPYLARKPSAA